MHWTEFIIFDDTRAAPEKTFWDDGNDGLASNQNPQGRRSCIHHSGFMPTSTAALETALHSPGALLKKPRCALITLTVTGRLYPFTLPA